MLKGFLRRQCQKLSLLNEATDLHVRVHHRLRDKRRPLAALGRGAELFSYVGDGLLLHRLGGRARLSHLHRCCGADRSAIGHDDLLGSQTDESAGGDRSLVHEGHRLNPSIQQRVADNNSRIHPPTEGIDVENDRRGARIGGLVKDALNERREAEINDPLDRRHVHHRRLLSEYERVGS